MPLEPGKRKTILIVDDEADFRLVLQTVLRKNGYETDEAGDGLEALKKIESFRPDVIIMDIMMPRLDGCSVNSKLKENPETAAIPVILITGRGHLKELLDMRGDFQVTAYLEKPFQVSTLLRKLQEILK